MNRREWFTAIAGLYFLPRVTPKRILVGSGAKLPKTLKNAMSPEEAAYNEHIKLLKTLKIMRERGRVVYNPNTPLGQEWSVRL